MAEAIGVGKAAAGEESSAGGGAAAETAAAAAVAAAHLAETRVALGTQDLRAPQRRRREDLHHRGHPEAQELLEVSRAVPAALIG